MHDLPLITTIAAAFTAAWLLGLCTQWLRLSPIVGYLLAGVLIGPHTPGFVGDVHMAQQLAEVGVILLMFGVGLHFHLGDLMRVKGVAIPGAIVQSAVATVLAVAVFAAFGMPVKTGLILGMAMAVASTVVLMRVLMDADALQSPQGHVAVGWLIVEDIFTVILLVLIPVLGTGNDAAAANDTSVWGPLATALAKLAILVTIVLVAGSRIIPWVLVRVTRLRSRELFTLTVLVFSVAIATASYVFFGASMALGAFLAGMVVSQSPVSHQAAADALPMRDAFAVLFFVSVGMLFDPMFLIERPLMIGAALAIVMLAKPLAALLIVALLGHSARTALTVAIGLAQIGEFSFILSELARREGLMPDAGHNVLVAAAILSITMNPVLFRAVPRIETWLRTRPRLWRLLNARAERRLATGQAEPEAPPQGAPQRVAVVVGYGPVGRAVHQVLEDCGIPTVVVDLNLDTISALRARGQAAIYGDASNLRILEQAGVRRASHVVVTLPDASQRAAVVSASRNLSGSVRIVVRAHYLREREELERGGATAAVFEEAEAAMALSRLVLADTRPEGPDADQKLREIQRQFILDNLSMVHSQPVSSIMTPWARVRCLSTATDPQTAMAQIAREGGSRWPVIDHLSRRPVGYLLAADLMDQPGRSDWPELVRKLEEIAPQETIGNALLRMRQDDAEVLLVTEAGRILGMLSVESIQEQVLARVDTERPHGPGSSLAEAVQRGAILPELEARTFQEAVREMASAVPTRRLPPGVDTAKLTALVLAREEEVSTDLGNGVALPHARCRGLVQPVAVVGRSPRGVALSGEGRAAHLFLLLVTPEERPELQLELLREVALLVRDETARAGFIEADSAAALLEQLRKTGSAL